MHKTNRRDVLRAIVASGLGLALETHARAAVNRHDVQSMEQLLANLGQQRVDEKVQTVQAILECVGFGPKGIMYSMQKLQKDGIRPFRADDFQGKTSLDASVGKLQLDGPHDYLHGENSITQSGLYLAAQSYRYEVTQAPKHSSKPRLHSIRST